MALNIKDRRTDELAREVAALSDKSITEALRETLELRVVELKTEREARIQRRIAASMKIIEDLKAAPVLDHRSTWEISDELDEDIFDGHR